MAHEDSDAISQRFGREVRRRRRELGLSQEALAERLDSNVQYISEIERGVANPTLKNVGRIAQALNCQVTELLAAGGGS